MTTYEWCAMVYIQYHTSKMHCELFCQFWLRVLGNMRRDTLHDCVHLPTLDCPSFLQPREQAPVAYIFEQNVTLVFFLWQDSSPVCSFCLFVFLLFFFFFFYKISGVRLGIIYLLAVLFLFFLECNLFFTRVNLSKAHFQFYSITQTQSIPFWWNNVFIGMLFNICKAP